MIQALTLLVYQRILLLDLKTSSKMVNWRFKSGDDDLRGFGGRGVSKLDSLRAGRLSPIIHMLAAQKKVEEA